MSKIDLHMHSSNSDGTNPPEELLKLVRNAGIKIFALTDHDTINGAMVLKNEPNFIKGIEFSCITQNNHKCHILGLGYDENNKDFQDALKAGEELRHEKFYRRIGFLRSEFKITFTDQEIEDLLKIPSVGKPHIGNLLVKKGYANSRAEAIDNYVDLAKTGNDKISAELAINAINSAGGVSVWAHPLGGERDPELPENDFRKILDELKNYGLRGLECYYSKYSYVKTKWLADVANDNKLFISGGSDYHGTNKKIPLGRLNSDDEEIAPELLTILDALNFNKGSD